MLFVGKISQHWLVKLKVKIEFGICTQCKYTLYLNLNNKIIIKNIYISKFTFSLD